MQKRVEKLDYDGNGVVHIDGKVCFIPRVLKDEVIDFHIVKEEKSFSKGVCDKIVESSPDRINSYCPYASKCGGCTFDIVSYEKSIALKKEILEEQFAIKNIEMPLIEIEKSIPNLGYRNKVSLKIENGLFGYYQSESHDFVSIETCYLVKDSIKSFLNDFNLLNVRNGELIIRSNYNDELLVIINSEEEPHIKESITDNHKIAGIIWNNKCIYNEPFFIEKRNNLLYKVHADSFFQVNSYIAEKIASDVISNFNENDEVFDLYCGVGYFSLKLASIVKKVIGVEINPKAILNAKYNADLNKLNNTSFHVGKVEDIISKIPNNVNKVLVDPPRSGLDSEVIQSLLDNNFESIYYVSCNSKTLIRDINLLKEKYEIKKIKAYDMFAFSKHLEVFCVLKLK